MRSFALRSLTRSRMSMETPSMVRTRPSSLSCEGPMQSGRFGEAAAGAATQDEARSNQVLTGEKTSDEGQAEVRQEHHRAQKEVRRIHLRGTSRDEGSRPRDEGGRAQGGRGKRSAREDRRDAGTGSRSGQAAARDHQGQRAGPLAENLVWDARVCPGRQDRLLLPEREEVQHEVRDVRLQRQGEPRRRSYVASRLRADEVDRRRRGKNRRAREESGELRTTRLTALAEVSDDHRLNVTSLKVLLFERVHRVIPLPMSSTTPTEFIVSALDRTRSLSCS